MKKEFKHLKKFEQMASSINEPDIKKIIKDIEDESYDEIFDGIGVEMADFVYVTIEKLEKIKDRYPQYEYQIDKKIQELLNKIGK